MIFGGLALLVMAGIGGAFLLGVIPRGARSDPPVPERPEMGPTVKLSPMILNLKDESGRYYLKATIVLEIEKLDKVEEVNKKMSSLTDIIILTLGDKRLEDLKDPHAKEKLKQELLLAMNQHLSPKTIRGIYFDEFLYQ